MDHHHKFVGFTFAFMGASLFDASCQEMFEYDAIKVRDGDKLLWGSIFFFLCSFVQLITSAYLAYKPEFLKLWSFLHAVLLLVYFITFFVLVAKTSDILYPRVYFTGILRNNFLLIPVIAFNLVHDKLPSVG